MALSSANLWVLLGLGIAGILLMTNKLKKAVKVDFGAFIQRLQLLPPPQPTPPKAPHPLTGLSFAVSDVFDIEGFVTGFGNPNWLRTKEPAVRTCPVVTTLVDSGATCIGKTVVDDMAMSISGENKHYGTPTNPASPSRVPGGASSGAAVAVAAKLADFFLGIDTDGGVRIPAAYCGIFGFRPSHAAISLSGMIPVSGSLDTVGWFAKDPSILRRVGHMLLQLPFGTQRNPRSVFIADDFFKLSKIPADEVTQTLIKSVEAIYGRQVLRHENLGDYIKSKVLSLSTFHSNQGNAEGKLSPISQLVNVMQLIKRHEFGGNHDEWINSIKPTIVAATANQDPEKPILTADDIENCNVIRNELRSAMSALLKDDGILAIPTCDPPPKLGAKEIYTEEHLIRTSTFSSIASLSGCCQVTIPIGLNEKQPVSLSLLARHGGDSFLLDTLQNLYASLTEQIEKASKPKASHKSVSQEESAEIAKEQGNQAFKDKQWQRAIRFYSEAIKLNCNNATFFSNRAAAYLELGSYVQAEADCTQAIHLDKKSIKAYLRRGTAREMLGYYREAMEDFRYALVLEPNNKRAAQAVDRLRKLFQ